MDTLDRGVLHVSEDWDCHSVRGIMIKGGVRCFSHESVVVTQSRRLQRGLSDAGFGRLESAPLARGQGRAAARRESATS